MGQGDDAWRRCYWSGRLGRKVQKSVTPTEPLPDTQRLDVTIDDVSDNDRIFWLRRMTYLLVGGLVIGLPFALQAGSEFFLPVTAALVLAVALVPALEWLERRGVPSGLASFLCVLALLVTVNGALALIIVPASDWFVQLPQRLPRVQATLSPLINFYSNLRGFFDETLQSFASTTAAQAQAVAIETPNSLVGYLSTAAPAAAIQTFFAILLIFFFLSGWTTLRRQTISSRGSFNSAMNTARLIQNVVDSTSAYLTTIVLINATLGLAVALLLWLIGMPSPFMWGGIVTLCNFVPYVGPIVAAGLLALGGLMSFDAVGMALLPAAIQIGLHLVESNLITPLVLGRRLTINPLLILLSLSYWGWIWGAPGACLAVPILIVMQTLIMSIYGRRPNWAGAAPAPPMASAPQENVTAPS